MNTPHTSAATLFGEAKRRRVVRVAALYAVVGFATIEGADIIFPQLSVPDAWLTVVLVAVLAGFPVALLVSWFFDLTPQGLKRTPDILHDSSTVAASSAAAAGAVDLPSEKSVAVLPFANMSDDTENEYFSDGITEEIINALTKVPGLHVAARTSSFSFKGRNEDVTQIGRDLRVATVLEGSVRKSGDRVRITAQLVKVSDGYHLWSEVYDRELADIFAVQDEIAQTIMEKLRVELLGAAGQPLIHRYTQDLDAYNLYLKGRYFWNQRESGIARGIEYFQQAIAIDEGYALAHAGLADSYNLLGFYGFEPPLEAFPAAKLAAGRALELAPDLGEAHVSRAFALMLHDWNWTEAEAEFRHGLELSPGYATGHHWYSEFLMARGRADVAITEARRAIELDPIGLIINTLLGMAYYLAGDYERAIEACDRTLELLPDFLPVYLWLGLSYLQAGRVEEGIEVFERMVAGSNGRPAVHALLGYAYAVAGRREDAEQVLAQLQTAPEGWYVSPFDLARVSVGLGDTDRALDLLEDAYDERAVGLVWTAVDPTLAPLHDEPRFRDLLERLDLAGADRALTATADS